MKNNARALREMKYLKALRELHLILSNTNRLSMTKFSDKHKVSKRIASILQKGRVIKCTRKGKYSEWVWTTIQPNIEMARKVLIELAQIQQSQVKARAKKTVTTINLENKNKTVRIKKQTDKSIVGYRVNLLFGLIKLNVKPIYN
jgi:prophage tail gpP-like protein